jgi:hypothetical protein
MAKYLGLLLLYNQEEDTRNSASKAVIMTHVCHGFLQSPSQVLEFIH